MLGTSTPKTDRFLGVRISIVERQCHRFYWGTVRGGLAPQILVGFFFEGPPEK
jgi:hypothetical protein